MTRRDLQKDQSETPNLDILRWLKVLPEIEWLDFHIATILVKLIDDVLALIRFQKAVGWLISLFVWKANNGEVANCRNNTSQNPFDDEDPNGVSGLLERVG